MREKINALLEAAATFMHGSTHPKTAIRRAARTADWKDDPERLAAADAKRARKMARRVPK
jgi:hypothetical protein